MKRKRKSFIYILVIMAIGLGYVWFQDLHFSEGQVIKQFCKENFLSACTVTHKYEFEKGKKLVFFENDTKSSHLIIEKKGFFYQNLYSKHRDARVLFEGPQSYTYYRVNYELKPKFQKIDSFEIDSKNYDLFFTSDSNDVELFDISPIYSETEYPQFDLVPTGNLKSIGKGYLLYETEIGKDTSDIDEMRNVLIRHYDANSLVDFQDILYINGRNYQPNEMILVNGVDVIEKDRYFYPPNVYVQQNITDLNLEKPEQKILSIRTRNRYVSYRPGSNEANEEEVTYDLEFYDYGDNLVLMIETLEDAGKADFENRVMAYIIDKEGYSDVLDQINQ